MKSNLHWYFLPYCSIYRVKRVWNKNTCGRGLIVSVRIWLNGCGLLLVDLMWVTGYSPALVLRDKCSDLRLPVTKQHNSAWNMCHVTMCHFKHTGLSQAVSSAICIRLWSSEERSHTHTHTHTSDVSLLLL